MIVECYTAVAKAAVAEREALWSKLEQNECRTFMEGCTGKLPIPIPSCPTVEPACKDGKCTAQM